MMPRPEFDRCNFCKDRYSDDICDWCTYHQRFRPDPELVIEKAKERELSVSDVIALIEFCDD